MPSRCGSAEGGYIRGSLNAREEEARTPKRVIHTANAQRVQKIYDGLPQITKQVVRFEYVQRRTYDQWELGEELGVDGRLHKVAIRVANTRRKEARRRLKIDRRRYQKHVDEFCQRVAREFGV